MDHFLEACVGLVWAKFGSEMGGYPLLPPTRTSFKVTHYSYHSKEYYFEVYSGDFGLINVNQEFELAETTWRRGDIPIHFRWMSPYYLELRHHFGFTERKYFLEWQNGGRDLQIMDESRNIEGRASGARRIELGFVTWQDFMGKELQFKVEPY